MKICVYGASSYKIDSSFIAAGEKLGELMAKRGHGLIFGGGANGMMGAAARGVYRQKGEIVGISPELFDVDGVLFDHCNEMIFTKTMRERKQLLEDMSDAFVVTAGGSGTYDEFFEILTLKQLGYHNKPIAILNTNGYFDKTKKTYRMFYAYSIVMCTLRSIKTHPRPMASGRKCNSGINGADNCRFRNFWHKIRSSYICGIFCSPDDTPCGKFLSAANTDICFICPCSYA